MATRGAAASSKGTALAETALREAGVAVTGQTKALRLALTAAVAGGHVLLEGPPGLAKTLVAKTLATVFGLAFQRLQCTPDLMPSDVTGYEILDAAKGGKGLRFVPGPVFTQFLLADELNRTPPKTQSALLQAMEEGEVTVGTERRALPTPFLVFATQNPLEQEGTYPLPEAQLDRFLLRIVMDYPSLDEEVAIAGATTAIAPERRFGEDDLLAARAAAETIDVAPTVLRWMTRVVRATRPDGDEAPASVRRAVRLGASPRSARLLVRAARAAAWLDGKSAVEKSHVEEILAPVLAHRLSLSHLGEADGARPEDLIRDAAALPLAERDR